MRRLPIYFLIDVSESMVGEPIEQVQNGIRTIIQELRNSLDMKYDISKNLYELYDYFLRQLIQANIKKDKDIFQEVLHFVEELRDTWVQVLEITKAEKLNNMNQ